jgi:hypothetical protein
VINALFMATFALGLTSRGEGNKVRHAPRLHLVCEPRSDSFSFLFSLFLA